MQLEYELELVAEVECLENGEYEKAWEEIAPVIQELYPVEVDNVVDDTEAVNAVVTQTVDLSAFITEKHDLTYRVVDDVKYSTNVYSITDTVLNYILVEEAILRTPYPEIKWYMYDMDGNLIFEQYTMEAVPETICIVEDNETTAIVVGIAQLRQQVFYKYNITESKVIETLYENAVETDNEVTYYVTIDGEEKVLYKFVRTDDGWEKDYSVSELSFAEVTEVYNAYTASN